MNFTSFKKVLILVCILAVPGFLYYLLQEKGKNRYKPLPYFGPKALAGTFHTFHGDKIPDTIYHKVGDFKLLNQDGDTLNWDRFEGKLVILNLFYIKDNVPAVDYTMNAVKALESAYGKNRIVSFLSLSIDPSNDQPQVLKAYGEKFGAKPGKWELATGDSTQIYNLVKKELYMDAIKNPANSPFRFTYSNLFVLLDTEHHIRGYYDPTHQEALSKLDDEIKVQITEVLRNTNDGR
jgi:protein SCO1/2